MRIPYTLASQGWPLLRSRLLCLHLLIVSYLLAIGQFNSLTIALAQTNCQVIYAGSGEGTGPVSDLFIANTDGTIARRLTNEGGSHREPIWSHDGTKVAAIDNFENEESIFIRDSTTGDYLGGSSVIFGIQKMYWSPSDEYIAFETSGEIGIYNIEQSTVNMMSDTGQNHLYGWSPDSKTLLYAHGSQMGQGLQLYNIETEKTPYLTEIYDTDATWSPDGQFVAFVRNTIDGQSGIFYVEVSSGFTRFLLSNSTARNLAWSPDGQSIAFASNSGIQFVNFKTAQTALISTLPSDDFPIWSPDSRNLLFSTNTEAQFPPLVIVDANGTNIHQIGEGQQRIDTQAHLGAWHCSDTSENVIVPTQAPPIVTNVVPSSTPVPPTATTIISTKTLTPTTATATSVPRRPSTTNTSTVTSIPVIVPTPSPKAINLYVNHIEVAQVIQTLQNDIPLIVGKNTLARVYVGVENGPRSGFFGQAEIDGITVELHGERDGISFTSLLPINQGQSKPSTTELDREHSESSFNFILPVEWLNGPGSLTVWAQIITSAEFVQHYGSERQVEDNTSSVIRLEIVKTPQLQVTTHEISLNGVRPPTSYGKHLSTLETYLENRFPITSASIITTTDVIRAETMLEALHELNNQYPSALHSVHLGIGPRSQILLNMPANSDDSELGWGYLLSRSG